VILRYLIRRVIIDWTPLKNKAKGEKAKAERPLEQG
jgi:hypothetical protein